ncbi:RING finger protein 24-like [Amphiura filiformis]|uniref:RING finger protein 24-like n=1 Tax=Amphiura filiformis TaxID=82378 RepID=UPI003B228AB1
MSDPEVPYLTFSQVAPFLIVAGFIFILNLIFCCYLLRLRSQGNSECVFVGYKTEKFDAKKITNDICAVCLEEFKAKEEIGVCKCRHGFHIACISKWLEAKRTCPICNTRVKPEPSERTYLVHQATASV